MKKPINGPAWFWFSVTCLMWILILILLGRDEQLIRNQRDREALDARWHAQTAEALGRMCPVLGSVYVLRYGQSSIQVGAEDYLSQRQCEKLREDEVQMAGGKP